MLARFDSNQSLVSKLWNEIETNYSGKKRHYHNLTHLNDLYEQLVPVKPQINNWNIIMFSLFYHDVIYDASKSNNEEKSAELAKKRMHELGIPNEDINSCVEQIIATKSHSIAKNIDTNYFTDADLSILGREWNRYEVYCQQIRKEYSIYPNFLYKKGRRKVVQHFISMEKIFKTEEFYNKYENQARSNLQKELQTF